MANIKNKLKNTYVIESLVEKDDTNEILYWNNQDGWTLKSHATVFTQEERNLFRHIPICSRWVKIS